MADAERGLHHRLRKSELLDGFIDPANDVADV